MKKEIGASIYDLYKELYPDLDDEQINEMVERSFAEKQRTMEMQAEIQINAMEARMKKTENGNPAGDGTVEKPETQTTEEIEMKKETDVKPEGASSNGRG